jgi:uncharacterized OB-fold protein
LSSRAKLYSYTVIHPNPKSGLDPFVLAYADFPEDVRVFGRLETTDRSGLRIGMEIRVVSRLKDGTDPRSGTYAFVPAQEDLA